MSLKKYIVPIQDEKEPAFCHQCQSILKRGERVNINLAIGEMLCEDCGCPFHDHQAPGETCPACRTSTPLDGGRDVNPFGPYILKEKQNRPSARLTTICQGCQMWEYLCHCGYEDCNPSTHPLGPCGTCLACKRVDDAIRNGEL